MALISESTSRPRGIPSGTATNLMARLCVTKWAFALGVARSYGLMGRVPQDLGLI